jgi:hypothetical protein
VVRTALVVAVLGCLASGCVVYGPPRRIVVARENDPPPTPNYDEWPSASEDPGTTVVEEAPPAVRYEVITESPGVDFVWVGGYWAWRGGWVWCPGCWRRCPPGYAWRSGVWVVRGGRSYWRYGGWVRHHR